MALDYTEFQHLCHLARLAPDEETGRLFAAQCDEIIAYMDILSTLDTAGVEPLYSPAEHGTLYRDDIPERHMSREDVLANAPETDGEFFIVPRILEGK